jgi:predicted PurR-regulated permease PerM
MSTVFPENSIARWLLVFVLIAAIYFFSGFVVPVLAALIIGFASWPLYERLLEACKHHNAVAATIALVIIIIVLVIPIAFAFSYAIEEIKIWVEWLVIANREGAAAPEWIGALPGVGEWLTNYWNENLAKPHDLGELVQLFSGEHIGNIYRWLLALSGTAFTLLLTLLFMLITLFFIYKDGLRLVAQLDKVGDRILPVHWQRFSRVVPATVSSTVTGMGLIALGEGVVLGVAYAIAGVPSPVALGVLTGFLALIPGGAPLAFTMVSIYLVGSGDTVAGVGLFIWGSVELFIVDKTLRPRLVGGPIKLPFLPTFFGLIGGVKTMGFVGLFVGPVLMAILIAIWKEWLHYIDNSQRSEEDL